MRPLSFFALAAISVLLGSGFLASCLGGSSSSSGGGCARARVGGRLTCLRAGAVCSPAHERIYRSYGLTCKAAAGGHRLRERTFNAPANP